MVKLLAVVNTLLFAGYPLAVYIGLTHFSARGVGLLLLVLWLPGLAYRARNARREDLLVAVRLPLSIITVAGLAAWLDDRRLVLALPVLINGLLLAQFSASLRTTPIVERFARMQQPTLSNEQRAYCRSVTVVWCGFFVLNAVISAALALRGPVAWWALYTGLVAYFLIGVVATVEYVVRKARFREYGPGLHDRVLSRLFPAQPGGKP